MTAARRCSGMWLAARVALIGGLLLSACAPSIGKDQAQSEIESFVLDMIVRRSIGGSASYVQTSGQSWANAPADAELIVWASPSERIDTTSIEYLKTNQPLRVWWLSGNQLTEVTSDKAAAIQEYRNRHMLKPPSDSRPPSWSYYEFGILSMSSGNRKAKVYVGNWCGPLCGTGMLYDLERNNAGRWEIHGSEMRWIS